MTAQLTARVGEVDALRGIAAVAVMLFHYTTRIAELYPMGEEPLISAPHGHYGVNLFFIISGYVIFMTLERTRQPVDFVVSRFSRLFPAYWAAVAVTFTVTWYLGLPGKTVTATQALGNLLMIHGFFKIPHVDGVYWTLEVELLFYAGMFALFMTGQLGRVHTWLWLALAFRLAYYVALHGAGVDLPWIVYRFLILEYIPWFTMGICVYLLMHAHTAADARKSWVLLTAAVALVGLTSGLAVGALAVALVALVFGAATRRLPWLGHPVMVWLGSISYTLYLLHENIGWAVQLQLRDLGVQRDVGILCVVALSLGMAWALTKCVEQPAMQWIRRRWRNRQQQK